MVSTPLLLTNLKLLSIVNSDSQKACHSPPLVISERLHVHGPTNCGHLCLLSSAICHQSLQCTVIQRMLTNPNLVLIQFKACLVFGFVRYIGALGARVICDNIPGLVNKQRQLCQRHPDIMQAIGEGTKEWIRECQHQFRHHRWNCSTLDRDHTVFGRVLLRSKSICRITLGY